MEFCLAPVIRILARNQSWLGSDVSSEITKWTNAGLTQAGLTKEDIVLELFESRHISGIRFATSIMEKPYSGTLLFATGASEC